jgi:membrane fusion protein
MSERSDPLADEPPPHTSPSGALTPTHGDSVSVRAPEANATLFRAEVLAERQTQWLGTVMLAPRASHRIFTLVALAITAAVIALLVFGTFTRTARVNGWLLPKQGLVKVIAPRPGLVSELAVQEGAAVRKGDRLLTLSDELQSASLGATQGRIMQQLAERAASLTEERMQQERLLAQQRSSLTDRISALRAEQAQIDRELELLQARVAIAERAEALYREQFRAGFISEMRLQAIESELLEQRARLGALQRSRLGVAREQKVVEAERDSLPLRYGKELGVLERTVAQLEQERAEVEARREIVVIAPQDGTVTAIHAVPGARADAAAPLMSIVPADTRLEAHLFGPSRAVGFVRPGQRVLLRYHAFPYQRFGHHQGVVANVSRAALSPGEMPPQLAGLPGLTGTGAANNAEPVYRITVELERQSMTAFGEELPLAPGMLLEADVALERRRLFEWVLDPLYAVTGRLRG